jgi:hypothetical protein
LIPFGATQAHPTNHRLSLFQTELAAASIFGQGIAINNPKQKEVEDNYRKQREQCSNNLLDHIAITH